MKIKENLLSFLNPNKVRGKIYIIITLLSMMACTVGIFLRGELLDGKERMYEQLFSIGKQGRMSFAAQEFEKLKYNLLFASDEDIEDLREDFVDYMDDIYQFSPEEVTQIRPKLDRFYEQYKNLELGIDPNVLKEVNVISEEISGDIDAILSTSRDETELTQIEYEEQVNKSVKISLYLLLALIPTVVISFIITHRNITSPLGKVTKAMLELAEGKDVVEIPELKRKDEVGEMILALSYFQARNYEAKQAIQEKLEQQKQHEEEFLQYINSLSKDFEESIGMVINGVISETATSIQSITESLSGITKDSTVQSDSLTTVSEQASKNVKEISDKIEDFSQKVSEVTNQINSSSSQANEAVEKSLSAVAAVADLEKSVENISSVVTIIKDIAKQINLLALNATIESARAGEAGKGFAVVANEVKSLVGQVSGATEDIVRFIESIQEETKKTAEIIHQISESNKSISESSNRVSEIVTEQADGIKVISVNAEETSSGTAEASKVAQNSQKLTSESKAVVDELISVTGDIGQQSALLNAQIQGFVSKIKSRGGTGEFVSDDMVDKNAPEVAGAANENTAKEAAIAEANEELAEKALEEEDMELF